MARRPAVAALALFVLGAAFGLLFTFLQAQHRVTVYKDEGLIGAMSTGFGAAGGIAAVVAGAAFPYADAARKTPAAAGAAVDSVRCIGLFLGMNYATSVR